jgi:hypothetical protein
MSGMEAGRGFLVAGAVVAAAAGLLCGGAALALLLSDPDGGANIGAGVLLLAGVPVALVGVALLVTSAGVHLWSSRARPRRTGAR